MRFENPYMLLLLLSIPMYIQWHRKNQIARINTAFSSLEILNQRGTSIWTKIAKAMFFTELLILLCLTIGLARPQKILTSWPIWGKGIDVMLVLDTSTSMLTHDFQPNRMEAARKMLLQLISQRRQKNDRLGLVLFAKKAYTLTPLTTDHQMLATMLKQVESGVLPDATALGDALATALARLRTKTKRHKAIILVTDGENNAGQTHPLVAAQKAESMKVKIFSVYVGREDSRTEKEGVDPWSIIQKISSSSHGTAFRVKEQTDFQLALQKLLNKMHPKRSEKPKYFTEKDEMFSHLVWFVLGLLSLRLLLQLTRFRNMPGL